MTFAALAALMGVVASAADEADIAAFREARFGMFIHWGLYAQLGGRWKGQKMDYIGEWIQSRFRIPNAEYGKLAAEFNPTKFDADDWARQAKAAGMEYVVFTTKHHEGFSMYATKVSDYNIVDATPFKRDAFGELAAACRRHGLKVGIYYSQALDWHEFDAAGFRDSIVARRSALANHGMDWGNTWDWPDSSRKNLERYLKDKVYPQLRELLTNYGEIFVLWFDCPQQMTKQQSSELHTYVKSLQPHVLVNSRIGHDLGDFGTMGDNQILAGKSRVQLESPMTLNDTWGFKYDDHHWKSGYQVACALMQTLSCDGNLLLNIGPRPDGRFPDAASDVLSELAVWRRDMGVQIKGAKESPFAQPMPWGWCTVADDNTLQFVIRSNWTNDVEVSGLRNDIVSCSEKFSKVGSVLKVRLLPPKSAMPRVVRVKLDGTPDVDCCLMPQGEELNLSPSACACLTGGRLTAHGSLTDWQKPGDGIVWKVRFPSSGQFRVFVRTESWNHGKDWVGDRIVTVRVGNSRSSRTLKKDIDLPHTVYDRGESDFGVFTISAPGEAEVAVENQSAGENAKYQDLTLVRLVRQKARSGFLAQH